MRKLELVSEALLEQLIALVPPPEGDAKHKTQALIIDSWFDSYVGVIILVRVMEGGIRPKQKVRMMSTGRDYLVEKVGIFTPKRKETENLQAGNVGFIIAGIKDIESAKVGDTITLSQNPADTPLADFKEVQPRVFAGLFPVSSDDYENCREALKKLKLNDAALQFEPETSQGPWIWFSMWISWYVAHGNRTGKAGTRIRSRFDNDSTKRLCIRSKPLRGKFTKIHNPADLPPVNKINEIREPIIQANILLPEQYIGAVIALCIEKRGVQKDMQYLGSQVSLVFELPLSEVVLDFFDRLKSVSRGYASFDYEFLRFEVSSLVKLDVLINSEKVDALSLIVHRENADYRGRELASKMKELIPRQMFDVAIQAAIGSNIVARTNVKALRKNVTAKCYGGDATRKKKLLEKQKAGKKRMKQVGSVEIPQDAFLAVLKVDS